MTFQSCAYSTSSFRNDKLPSSMQRLITVSFVSACAFAYYLPCTTAALHGSRDCGSSAPANSDTINWLQASPNCNGLESAEVEYIFRSEPDGELVMQRLTAFLSWCHTKKCMEPPASRNRLESRAPIQFIVACTLFLAYSSEGFLALLSCQLQF